MQSCFSSHCDSTVQGALDALEADEILRVGGAGHKVIILTQAKLAVLNRKTKTNQTFSIHSRSCSC